MAGVRPWASLLRHVKEPIVERPMETRLELANPNAFASPREYIEKHLAPVASELHRLVNEFVAPGSTTSEEGSVDMTTQTETTGEWGDVSQLVDPPQKSVLFDGREYFDIGKDSLRTKQVKVQLTAVCYVRDGGVAEFRLIRGDGSVILGSTFRASSNEPSTHILNLPIGETDGCVTPHYALYVMQARRLDKRSIPVCRRFSMQFILI